MHVKNTVTVAGAAELANMTEFAIRTAIKRGELETIETRCGRAKLLSLAAVKKWIATPRPRGPKPKGL